MFPFIRRRKARRKAELDYLSIKLVQTHTNFEVSLFLTVIRYADPNISIISPDRHLEDFGAMNM